MRAIFPHLLLLGLFSACTGDGGTSTEDTGTGDSTGNPTGEPTTGEPTDLNDRELGAGASELCLGAMTHVAQLTQAVRAGDAAAAVAAYTGTDLQKLVVAIDGTKSMHDAAITASGESRRATSGRSAASLAMARGDGSHKPETATCGWASAALRSRPPMTP